MTPLQTAIVIIASVALIVIVGFITAACFNAGYDREMQRLRKEADAKR